MRGTTKRRVMTVGASIGLALGALCNAEHARADDPCGQQPAPTEYSRDFYKAQAKYYASNTQMESSATFPIEGIPVKGSLSGSQALEGWETLTLAEAERIIQREHEAKEAQILAECGYRMCRLKYAGGSALEVTTLAEVCQGTTGGGMRPGVANPDSHSSDPLMGSPSKPASRAVVFDSEFPEKTVHYIKNRTPATMVLTWHIDGNQDRDGSDLLTLEEKPKNPARPPKRPRPLRTRISIKPHGTFEYVVVAKRPQRPIAKPSIVFGWRGNQDYSGELRYMLVREEHPVVCRDDVQGFTDYPVEAKNRYYTGAVLGEGHEIIIPMRGRGEQAFAQECSVRGEAAGWTHFTNGWFSGNTYFWRGWSNSGAPADIACSITSRTVRRVCEVDEPAF